MNPDPEVVVKQANARYRARTRPLCFGVGVNRTLIRKAALVAVIGCSIFLLVACGSKVEGTYLDADGSFILELRSGGQATFTFMGETASCTYAVDGNKLTLNCKGEASKTVSTIHGDGSLTGPPGTFMPALRSPNPSQSCAHRAPMMARQKDDIKVGSTETRGERNPGGCSMGVK